MSFPNEPILITIPLFWSHHSYIFARQSDESTQLWKKLRLSFGCSSSVAGGVRKLSLGVAGTGGVISAYSSMVDGTDALGGVVLTGR